MAVAAFQQNAIVLFGRRKYRMLRKISETHWQLEEDKTKRIIEKTGVKLRSMYARGQLIFESRLRGQSSGDEAGLGRPHIEIPPALFADAMVRRVYALAAMNTPASKAAIEDVAKKTWIKLGKPDRPPHWTTVYRWRKRLLRAGRDIEGLVVNIARRGNRTRRYPEEVIAAAENAIDVVYLTEERKTIQDTVDRAQHDINLENRNRPEAMQLPLPTRRLVSSLIDRIPAFDRCMAREGRDVAMRRFRAALGHRIAEEPLQRCEIDHTRMDLMVIDDETGLPLGRPVLSGCIDDYTRCFVGVNVGFEPPGILAVARCLKNAFLPKTDLRSQYPEIKNEWEAHGVMRELSMDDAPEFHSSSLEKACYSLGIEMHYAPRKTPWFKGKIERALGTLNASVAHGVPGTTFSNIFDKEDYDPVKHAVVRLSTLQCVVRKWIVDVYHQRPHRTLKQPPAVLWKSSIDADRIVVPEDPARLDAVLGRREQRVLTHKGIELDHLFYNSPDLAALRMQLGEKLDVEVCVDDGDIGKIIVLSPDKRRMFTVPALDQRYADGMTAWQHGVCKRYAAQQLGKYDSAGWLEAKERIAELIREEFALKRKRAHSRIARYRYGSGALAVAGKSTAVPAGDGASPPGMSSLMPARAPAQAQSRKFTPVMRQRGQGSFGPTA